MNADKVAETETPTRMKFMNTNIHQGALHDRDCAPRLLMLLAFLLVCSLSSAVTRQIGHSESHLLVKWRDGPESAAAVAGNAQIGGRVKQNFHAIGWQL